MSLALRLDNFDGNFSYGEQFLELYANAAVTVDAWVALDAGDTANPGADPFITVRPADSANADALHGICGVATRTTTAAGMVVIQIAGRRTGVNVAATVVEGEPLVASATAGRAQDANQLAAAGASYDYRVCGQAVTTAAANVSTVDIFKHPRFGQG
jgi:hypothetical protein